jgi:hypothetical protein
MDAIKVVSERRSDDFERECNELAEQGYIMQSCYCGYFNPNLNQDYSPEPIWFAIFALLEHAQQRLQTDSPPSGSKSE